MFRDRRPSDTPWASRSRGSVIALLSCALLGCRRHPMPRGQPSGEGASSRAPRAGATGVGMADEQLPVTQSWDWNGVIGTGRSLAVGVQAQDVTLTKQSFNNLKLALGNARVTVPPYDAGDPGLSIAALAEPIRPEATVFPSAYPFNIFGETPHPAMADQISALSRRGTGLDYVTVHMVV